MSNQRAGKTYRASAGDTMADMKLRNFFRSAAEILNECDEKDAAFYFEQVVDFINDGGRISDERSKVATILGV